MTTTSPSSTTPRASELLGYFYMFLAFAFSLPVSLIIHDLSIRTPLTSLNCYFIRCLLGLPIALLVYFALPANARSVPREYRIPLLLRSFSGAFATACFYQSLHHLPIGPATSILFLHPVLIVFFSTCLLHEHLARVHYISAFLSTFGVVLISNREALFLDTENANPLIGMFFAFSAAFLVTAVCLLARHIGFHVHFMVSALTLAVCSFIVSAITGGMMSFAQIIDLKQYVFVAVVPTVCAICGQAFSNMGFQHCRAAPGALIRTLDLPCVYILGLLFFGEVPTWKAALGALMVFTAVLLVIGAQLLEASRQRSVRLDVQQSKS